MRRVADGKFDKVVPLRFSRAQVKVIFCVWACSAALLGAALGGEPQAPPPESLVMREGAESAFAKGAKEFQNVTGAFRFFDTGENDRPSLDYVVNSIRLGVMLNDPHGSSLLAGNFEFLGEFFGGPIVQGPGNVVAGATLIFRYNFIQPRARIVPYFQLGGGGAYTDVTSEESAGLISSAVSFNLQGALGFRYLLNDRWSLVGEAEYRHISNAGLHSPNVGVNNLGGNVGFGFSF